MNRLSLLHGFYEEDPADPFNAYALVMEYLNAQPEACVKYFEELLQQHPNYLPTYYHAAAYFADRGEAEKADDIYQKGIALATAQGNDKTLRELRGAYQNFLFEF